MIDRGDWVCFYNFGNLAFSKVEFMRQEGLHPMVLTIHGQVRMENVLEVRKQSGEVYVREDKDLVKIA